LGRNDDVKVELQAFIHFKPCFVKADLIKLKIGALLFIRSSSSSFSRIIWK